MQKLYYSFIVLLIGFFAKAQTTTAPISPTPAISPIGIGLFAAPIGGGGGGSGGADSAGVKGLEHGRGNAGGKV